MYQLIEGHYRLNREKLVKTTRGMAGSNSEDVVHQGYANALQYWRSYDPESERGLDGWISGILKNASIRHYRMEIKNGMVDEGNIEHFSPLAVTDPFTVIQLIEAIESIKEQEPDRARILWLHLIDNFTTGEIDMIVEEKHDNIRKIIERFRKELKEK